MSTKSHNLPRKIPVQYLSYSTAYNVHQIPGMFWQCHSSPDYILYAAEYANEAKTKSHNHNMYNVVPAVRSWVDAIKRNIQNMISKPTDTSKNLQSKSTYESIYNCIFHVSLHTHQAPLNNEGELIAYFNNMYPMDDRFPKLVDDNYHVTRQSWFNPVFNTFNTPQPDSVIVNIQDTTRGLIGYPGIRRTVQYINNGSKVHVNQLNEAEKQRMKIDLMSYLEIIYDCQLEFTFDENDIYKTDLGLYYISNYKTMHSSIFSSMDIRRPWVMVFPRLSNIEEESFLWSYEHNQNKITLL